MLAIQIIVKYLLLYLFAFNIIYTDKNFILDMCIFHINIGIIKWQGMLT